MLSAATTGTARSTAAATPLAQRVGGGYAESGSWAGINIFYINGTTAIQQSLFYKKLNAVVLENRVVVFWLIQSQSQRGTGSATLHQGDTQSRIDVVLLHVFLNF